MTRQRKGRVKEDIDRDARSSETILQKGITPERQEKGHLEKKIVHCASTAEEAVVVMIENVIIGPNVKWERIVHSFDPTRRSDLQSPLRKKKEKRKSPTKEKVTVAIATVANHRPRNTSGKLLHFETSNNTLLKTKENLEQVGQSKVPMKGILAL